MGRRFLRYLSTLSIVFMIALSIMHIPSAISHDKSVIIDSLEELRDYVSELPCYAFEHWSKLVVACKRWALSYKVKAVIRKIKCGNFEGAIKKLAKDIMGKAEKWLVQPWETKLKEKVQYIISLIKGIAPTCLRPEASFVFAPETPLAGEKVIFDASASKALKVNDFDDDDCDDNELFEFSGRVIAACLRCKHDRDGTIVSYTWNFGDNTIITESDPVTTHIYATYGVYTVSLTVTNNYGLNDTESKPVEVIAPPTASFTYSPLVPLVNEVIIFNASGSASNGGEIESYMWDFDDDFTKTGEIVTHAYTAEETYSVVLNVTDTEGLWDTSTADITVYAPSVVDLPPKIIGVFRVPEEPNYDEHVRILASVIDIEGEVESVILGYSINTIDWTNLTMTFNENIGFYSVEIPPQPYNSTVNYKVYASDNMGNWNVSATYSYTVGDKHSPIVEIEKPTEGSYLRGLVNIKVSVQEDNLVEAKLLINDTVVSSWQESGKHVFTWNTSSSDFPDGTYRIKLSASDKADNSAEKAVTVTVDNTLPTATVDAPSEGAFLRRTVIIEITGEDANLDEMVLKINDLMIKTWCMAGTHIHQWNTRTYSEGTYRITLTVYDKAGNSKETSITTVVDNASPLIEAPTWKPEEPYINEQVNITVKVSDIHPGSGIRNVTLLYRNTTIGDWQLLQMSPDVASGNWTATIPAQSMETTIEFYIEAFDNNGNKAITDEIHEYDVVAPPGIPLAWIIAIILLILAATVAVIYYFWRKRGREEEGTNSGA